MAHEPSPEDPFRTARPAGTPSGEAADRAGAGGADLPPVDPPDLAHASNPAAPPAPRRRRGRTAAAVGLLAAGAIAGGVLAGSISASAGTSTSAGAPAASSASSSAGTPERGTAPVPGSPSSGGSADGTQRHGPGEGLEEALDAATAAKVEAAALDAVPGATVDRTETDSGDAEYEAHVTRSDGTRVTVSLDADFEVIAVEEGMGHGGPPPAA